MFHPSIFICEKEHLNHPPPWLWVQNDSKLSVFPPKAELQTATPAVASASASMVWQPMWIRETWKVFFFFLRERILLKVLLCPPWKLTFWTTKVMEVEVQMIFLFKQVIFGWTMTNFQGCVARACPGPKRIFHLPTIDFQYIFRGLLLLVSGRVSLTKGAVWSWEGVRSYTNCLKASKAFTCIQVLVIFGYFLVSMLHVFGVYTPVSQHYGNPTFTLGSISQRVNFPASYPCFFWVGFPERISSKQWFHFWWFQLLGFIFRYLSC